MINFFHRHCSTFWESFYKDGLQCNLVEKLLNIGECLLHNKGVSKCNQITIHHESRTLIQNELPACFRIWIHYSMGSIDCSYGRWLLFRFNSTSFGQLSFESVLNILHLWWTVNLGKTGNILHAVLIFI